MKAISYFYTILLLTFFACSTETKEQAATPNPTASQDTTQKVSAMQHDSTFVRLQSSTGQTIYVPVYSHIYQLNQQKTFNLTATLSFRNADINRPLVLKKVLYYDSEGVLVKNYLENEMTIKPLASTSFVVEENDLRGGVGANFIIAWEAGDPVYPPIVEAVMISTSQQQGISFVSVGRVLQESDGEARE